MLAWQVVPLALGFCTTLLIFGVLNQHGYQTSHPNQQFQQFNEAFTLHPALQGCAVAEPGGPWRLTFVLGGLENLSFFIEIICWEHWISQVQSAGLPSIFLRAQPCCIPMSLIFFAVHNRSQLLCIGWITLSTGKFTFQQIMQLFPPNICGICWMVIYPVDSIIQLLNNRG